MGALIIFGVTAGWELLYETDIRLNAVAKDVDTYIFIVDDSGTMQDNDPTQTRFLAIEEFIQGKTDTTRYTVYTFSDDVTLIQPMTAASGDVAALRGNSYGMTNIKAALAKIKSKAGLYE